MYGLLAHNGYQADDTDEHDDEPEPTDFDDDIKQVQTATKIDIDLHMDMTSTDIITKKDVEYENTHVKKHTIEIKDSNYEG